MTAEQRSIRCAIYTRKSSEEGLEQSFNSLEAQWEACTSYINIHRGEGWKVVDTRYDDGGYSGGSMERPGLKRLLYDIETAKVDVVMVYKVDRLTRSLVDFAKIIEILDAKGVSFVSVTQQFNTTNSMGRLTLNVLLSFAQFERELTSERIRDKIAASKQKGLWMGGRVPIGYDVANRRLIPNAREAQQVRLIFRMYLEQESVARLKTELDRQGIRSKQWIGRDGGVKGGVSYSRGALYWLLRNRVCLGQIKHKDMAYVGTHEAIVPKDLWDAVQAKLVANRQARASGFRANRPAVLCGILYDSAGNRFTPSHATKKQKRYRYYVNRTALLGRTSATRGRKDQPSIRISAWDLEELVYQRIRALLKSGKELLAATTLPTDSDVDRESITRGAKDRVGNWPFRSTEEIELFIRSIVHRITVRNDGLEIAISVTALRKSLLGAAGPATRACLDRATSTSSGEILCLRVDANFARRRGQVHFARTGSEADSRHLEPNVALLAALARARHWHELLISGEVSTLLAISRLTGLSERYVRRIVRLAFLSPRIVERIVRTEYSQEATLGGFFHQFPSDWREQHAFFGI